MDFAGTDAQVDRAINCALCYTNAMAMYGVKVCTSPNLPNNEGAWRPITLERAAGLHRQPAVPRAGRLAHADRPLRADAGVRLPRPDRAGARDGGLRLADVGHEPVGRARRRRASPTPTCSSTTAAWAATRSATASPACRWPSNVSSTSIEISEHIAPLRFHHKKLRPDSGGAGRHRGGLGQEILIESRSETPIAVSFLAERTIFPAFGIEGGRDGAPGELRINGEQDRSQEAVRAEQGRHRLARHAGRRRPWRPQDAARRGTRGRRRGGVCDGSHRLSSDDELTQTRGNEPMKIAYSAASPYVRKVMACAIARGLNDKIERMKIGTTDPALLAVQPAVQGADADHRRRHVALRQPGDLRVSRQHRHRAEALSRAGPGALEGADARRRWPTASSTPPSRAAARSPCRRTRAARPTSRCSRARSRARSTRWRRRPTRSAC